VALLLLALPAWSVPAEPAPALVLVAASLAPAVEAALRLPGAPRATVSVAGTGELVRQVRAGARADLLFAADEASVQQLAGEGKVRASRAVLSNRLAVVVPASSPARGDARGVLGEARRIGLADPAAVPAGRYARAWLERVGLWASVQGRVVPLLDARACFAAVAAGRVDAAVVYATDARRPGVRVVAEVPTSEGPAIRHVLARLSERAEAKAVEAFLLGAAAERTYVEAGYGVVE
jgi:molybdate transport system substrate-binding protein